MNKTIIISLVAIILLAGIISTIIIITSRITPDYCQNIKDHITIIYSSSCPACEKAIPILNEIEKEKNLNFTYFNVLENPDAYIFKVILIKTIPTIIIKKDNKCKMITGFKSKETYLKYI